MLNTKNISNNKNQLDPISINSTVDFFLNEEPILIFNSDCTLIHYNDPFKYSILSKHFFYEEENYFLEIQKNIRLFSSTSFKYSAFNLEITENDNQIEFIVTINRIKLIEGDLFILKFIDSTKLIERENRLASIQTALEVMKIPLLIASSRGNVIYISEEFEKICDVTLDSIYNKFFCLALEKIFSKEDLLSLENSFLNNQLWKKVIEYKDRQFNNISYKEVTYFPVAKFINGDKLNFIIIYDITTYVEKKNEAEQNAEKILSILNSIKDPVFIINNNSNYLALDGANKSFYQLFDCNHTKIGTSIEKIIDKELFNILKINISLMQNLENNDKEFEFSFHNKHFKGLLKSLSSSNSSTQFIVSLNDITQEIEYRNKINAAYKKELELNKLKNAFIENISHEIRTPFHAISGYSDILDECLEKEDYGSIKEITNLFKDVLGRVTKLFDNLIELSHLESKEMYFEFKNINPNKIIKNIYEKFLKRTIEKGIQLLLDLNSFDNLIRVDPNKLDKIISSLVDNSIKYTHYGNIILRTYSKDKKIFIAITDTGEGMNQNEIDNLLQPFSQEEDTFTRKYQGMGLGLTIAYKLTKLMGGFIEIISQKNVGTKVVISFNIVE